MACTQLSTKERLRQRESALAEQCAERRRLEQQLREQFDHTFLVNADDPLLEDWRRLHEQGALDLRVMDNVGMESTAALVWDWANSLLKQRDGGRSCCWAVEARENSRNAAQVHAVPSWFEAAG